DGAAARDTRCRVNDGREPEAHCRDVLDEPPSARGAERAEGLVGGGHGGCVGNPHYWPVEQRAPGLLAIPVFDEDRHIEAAGVLDDVEDLRREEAGAQDRQRLPVQRFTKRGERTSSPKDGTQG